MGDAHSIHLNYPDSQRWGMAARIAPITIPLAVLGALDSRLDCLRLRHEPQRNEDGINTPWHPNNHELSSGSARATTLQEDLTWNPITNPTTQTDASS